MLNKLATPSFDIEELTKSGREWNCIYLRDRDNLTQISKKVNTLLNTLYDEGLYSKHELEKIAFEYYWSLRVYGRKYIIIHTRRNEIIRVLKVSKRKLIGFRLYHDKYIENTYVFYCTSGILKKYNWRVDGFYKDWCDKFNCKKEFGKSIFKKEGDKPLEP